MRVSDLASRRKARYSLQVENRLLYRGVLRRLIKRDDCEVGLEGARIGRLLTIPVTSEYSK
jgi:hypothetical protein